MTPSLVTTYLPSPALRRFICHYWVGLHDLGETCEVLPDGAVDLVLCQTPSSIKGTVYGGVTARTVVALARRASYVGIRFRPGQSRYFLRATAAELTDRREPAEHLVRFPMEQVLDSELDPSTPTQLDAALRRHLCEDSAATSRTDAVVGLIEARSGVVRIHDIAAAFDIGRRQLERSFLETVGVPPKLFCAITRFRRATGMVRRSSEPLSRIAAAAGYADQSHMNSEFRRFAGISPAAYARGDVAFLQDAAPALPHRATSD